MQRVTLLGAGMLVVALFAGCGGSDDGDSELREAIADLRTRDLPMLVLPASEIGSLAHGFDVDFGSGPVDNAMAAENSINPDDTERDMERKGRIAGYGLDYSNPSPGDEDVLQVGTSVSLWEDADKASSSLQSAVAEFLDYEGEEVDGLVLAKAERFDVGNLGDEAIGVRIELEVPGLGSIYGTAVYVRLDRLGLNVNMIGLSDEDYGDDMVAMARKHVQWVTDVVTGDLTPVPVEIPEPVDPVDPGSDVPPLDEASLQLSDLPGGFVETERGFNTTNPAGIYDFTSAFESTGEYAPLGNSLIASIENNIIVYESTIEAQAFIGAIAGLLDGDSGAEFMLEIFRAEGVPATSVETERRDIDFGDQTVAVIARAETTLGNVVLNFTLVRTGATVTNFIVVADGDTFDLQDLGPIVEEVVNRVLATGVG